MMELAEKYLPSWLPESGTKSQLKRSWLKEALDIMEEINLAERNGKTYSIHIPREKNRRMVLIGVA